MAHNACRNQIYVIGWLDRNGRNTDDPLTNGIAVTRGQVNQLQRPAVPTSFHDHGEMLADYLDRHPKPVDTRPRLQAQRQTKADPTKPHVLIDRLRYATNHVQWQTEYHRPAYRYND